MNLRFEKALKKYDDKTLIPALIGDQYGNIVASDDILVSDAGHIFVRNIAGKTIKVFNDVAPLIRDLQVLIDTETWKVVSVRESYVSLYANGKHLDDWITNHPNRHSNKERCVYCGSSAPNDERGNCGACGAPRNNTG